MLRFLASIRFAVVLIAAIAVMAVLATVFPEANAYESWSFKVVVGLFFINLLLCTVKIIPKFIRTLKRTAADIQEGNPQYQQYALTKGRADDEIVVYCREEKYRTNTIERDGKKFILAKKGVASLFAPHFLHVAILIIIIGAAITTTSVSGGVMAYIGQTSPLPSKVVAAKGYAEAKLEVVDFVTDYDESGKVDNWVTTFNLYVDGEKVVVEGVTRVNFPYKYENLVIRSEERRVWRER